MRAEADESARDMPRIETMSTHLVKAACSLATAILIIIGDVYVVRGGPEQGRGDFNGVFFGLLAVALLPTLVYASGVRRPDSVLYYGLALFLITAAGWIFVFTSDDAFRGVFVFPAFFVTLVTSLVGTVRDRLRSLDEGS